MKKNNEPVELSFGNLEVRVRRTDLVDYADRQIGIHSISPGPSRISTQSFFLYLTADECRTLGEALLETSKP